MALSFPINPTVGQIYQTGSSSEYEFNGSYWTVVQPSAIELISAISASYAETASHALNSGGVPETASYALTASHAQQAVSSSYSLTASHLIGASETASYALTASFVNNAISASYSQTASFVNKAVSSSYSLTASHIEPLVQEVKITGSLEIAGDLTVVGSATFIAVTASNVVVDQNTITVFGSGSNLPRAGFIASDTGSTYASGTFLYNLPEGQWESNSPIVADSFIGTASYSEYAETSSYTITASYAVISDEAISASYIQQAVSSSYALTASFVRNAVSSSIAARANTTTLSYASILFNGFPDFAGSDITPVLGIGQGINVVGNTMVFINPGVYQVRADLGIRCIFGVYGWVDASNVVWPGTNTGVCGSVNSSDPTSVSGAGGIIVTTSPNTLVKLRILNIGSFNPAQFPSAAGAQIIQIR
jgi:hypothetical protein